MTEAELAEIRGRWSGVTVGHWEAIGMGSEGYNIYTEFGKSAVEQPFRGGHIADVRGGKDWAELRANGVALGHAKEDVRRLLNEIDALKNLQCTRELRFDGPLTSEEREGLLAAIDRVGNAPISLMPADDQVTVSKARYEALEGVAEAGMAYIKNSPHLIGPYERDLAEAIAKLEGLG